MWGDFITNEDTAEKCNVHIIISTINNSTRPMSCVLQSVNRSCIWLIQLKGGRPKLVCSIQETGYLYPKWLGLVAWSKTDAACGLGILRTEPPSIVFCSYHTALCMSALWYHPTEESDAFCSDSQQVFSYPKINLRMILIIHFLGNVKAITTTWHSFSEWGPPSMSP